VKNQEIIKEKLQNKQIFRRVNISKNGKRSWKRILERVLKFNLISQLG